ncbi:uncharacterized protein VTP21DRAFT_11073 [Calcarisporiella thermophila]|uniref:uncharacterized protein n=1 Tax=Calcarisporiella thermophila TaxID=911321 RepID=UPI0037435F86
MPASSLLLENHATVLTFDFEEFIKTELGLDLNKEFNRSEEVCRFYIKGQCQRGSACPNRHGLPREKAVVCKHWLRGLCKKGEQCEFLHEYNLRKMPECWFYSKYGECCNGDECMYQHIDPDNKAKECPWYARGFCKHGPHCRNKHIRAIACQNYLTGFCPLGPECPNGHPKYELPKLENEVTSSSNENAAYSIPEMHNGPIESPRNPSQHHQQQPRQYRNIEDVTCFKCGQKGHYANKCPNQRVHGIRN